MRIVDFIFEYVPTIICALAFPFVVYKAYKTIMNYDEDEFKKYMQK